MSSKKLSRRQFVKGGAVSVGAIAASLPVVGTAAAAEVKYVSPHEWENVPDPIPASEIAETIDADVVVVGAGTAGCCAAQGASELGVKVVLLEKTDSISARGHDVGVANCKFQKENGVVLSVPEMRDYYARLVSNKINMDLFNIWAYRSGEVLDHYIDIMTAHNVPITLPGSLDPSTRTTEDPTRREFATAVDFGDGKHGQMTEDGVEFLNHRFVRIVCEEAVKNGVQVFYDTPAVRLLRDGDGPVTGVIGQREDGSYIQVNAAKGVILATGGIDGNEDMMNMWAPYAAKANKLFPDAGGNTGDGIKLGMWIGAGHQKTHAAAMALPSAMAPNGPLANPRPLYGWLDVNIKGKRFTNEGWTNSLASNAAVAQPGSVAYSIYDSEFVAKAAQMNPANVIEDNDDLRKQMDDAIARGLLFKADTIEELAEAMGAPADALVATVARYNELVAKGIDEDYAKDPKYLTSIEVPPFYASQVKCSILVCPYGLNVDSHARVCTQDDEVIDGLWAIGNCMGNMLTDHYPFLIPGISHGRAITFGYLVGQGVAKGELVSAEA